MNDREEGLIVALKKKNVLELVIYSMFCTVSYWMNDNKYHCSILQASPGLMSCQRAGKSRIICKYEYYWGRNQWSEFTRLPPKRMNHNTQRAVLEAPPSFQILTVYWINKQVYPIYLILFALNFRWITCAQNRQKASHGPTLSFLVLSEKPPMSHVAKRLIRACRYNTYLWTIHI